MKVLSLLGGLQTSVTFAPPPPALTELEPDIQRLLGTDLDLQKRSSALFILRMKEKKRVTQVAIDDMVEGSRAIFEKTVKRLQAGMNEKLAHAGIDPNSIDGLQDVFTELSDPFKELDTEYLQEKYFKEELGIVVSSTMHM